MVSAGGGSDEAVGGEAGSAARPEVGQAQAGSETTVASPPCTSRRREVVGTLFFGLVFLGVGWAVLKNRDSFVATIHDVGVWGVLVSLGFGLVGVGATGMQWRAVLAGLGVRLRTREALRVYFVSQLGKYLPGSVWPIVMQMEAGREHGASRRSMLAGNVITLVLGLASGLVLAGILLPFSSPEALRRFWWALAALPLIVLLALPRTLPFVLDRLLALLRREPLGVQMTTPATLRAVAWATLSWVGLGLSLAVLSTAVGGFSASLVALSIGGMGLAVSAGVLFIPAPAGAGLRELVLGLVLVAVVTSGQAVAVVVASRVLLIVVDVILAGGAAVAGRLAARSRVIPSVRS